MTKFKKNGLLFIVILICSMSVYAKEQKDSFKVVGKCDMCKNRIETAATSLEGVAVATWDAKTQELTIVFDKDKVSLQQVQTAITMKGHDTEMFKASDKRYDELPACCKYPRNNTKKSIGNEDTECGNKHASGSCCKKE